MKTRHNGTRPALAIVFAASLAAAAVAASIPYASSVKPASPIRLDGKVDDWAGVPRVTDPKTSTELAFQNDGKNLYVLVVLYSAETRNSAQATGLTVIGRALNSRKPAKGALFLSRETSPDKLIAWQESQGAVLTEQEKAEIRRTPRHPIALAFAVDANGSSYGPLRKQTETWPPDFGWTADAGGAVYELRLPLAPPETVAGAIDGIPGSGVRLSFAWGGTSGSSLTTESGRKVPANGTGSGYVSGTGRTWGQEYLDNYDPMSRPNFVTKGFKFSVDVGLADAR